MCLSHAQTVSLPGGSCCILMWLGIYAISTPVGAPFLRIKMMARLALWQNSNILCNIFIFEFVSKVPIVQVIYMFLLSFALPETWKKIWRTHHWSMIFPTGFPHGCSTSFCLFTPCRTVPDGGAGAANERGCYLDGRCGCWELDMAGELEENWW